MHALADILIYAASPDYFMRIDPQMMDALHILFFALRIFIKLLSIAKTCSYFYISGFTFCFLIAIMTKTICTVARSRITPFPRNA